MGRDRIRGGGCLHVGKCVWIRKGSDRMYNADSLNNARINNHFVAIIQVVII